MRRNDGYLCSSGLRRAAQGSALLAALSIVLLLPWSAPAQEIASGRVVLVYDSSGSMEQTTSQARRKYAVARHAVDRLLSRLLGADRGNRVGLLAFGHRESNRPERRTQACRDIEELLAVQPLNEAMHREIVGATRRLRPSGFTPLKDSIMRAADMLGSEGGNIVIVSDFEETCDGTPEAACRALDQYNLGRADANRVRVLAIVVPRSPNMDMDPIHRLAACSHARVIEAAAENDAAEEIAALAEDLARFRRPTLRTEVMSPDLAGLQSDLSYLIRIRDNQTRQVIISRNLATAGQPVEVDPGTYTVELVHEEVVVWNRPDVHASAGDEATIIISLPARAG